MPGEMGFWEAYQAETFNVYDLFLTPVQLIGVLYVQCPYEKNSKVMTYVQTLPVFSETSEFCIQKLPCTK